MTIKPFAIQGSDLTLGGVNLQAGTSGVVIPGVTRATSYIPEEVNDTGDQTHAFTTIPVVIDHTYYSILNGDYSPSGYTEAEYAVTELDGEGFIDGIDIISQGSGWNSTSANGSQNNNMWAYIGSAENPFASFVNTDWIQIPFRVKIRAGEIETIGSGGNANTGNFTFDADTITNNNGMVFVTNRGTLSIGANMETPGVAQHFHIAFDGSNSNSPASDLFLGDDYNYVKLPGYELNPTAQHGVEIRTNNRDGGNLYNWRFDTDGGLKFPDNTVQTTAYTGQGSGYVTTTSGITFVGYDAILATPGTGTTYTSSLRTGIPSFLTVDETVTDPQHGFNTNGMWFEGNAGLNGFPVRTNFTINETDPVIVEFDFIYDQACADQGVCIFVDGGTPNWSWGGDGSCISAKYNCGNPQLDGQNNSVHSGGGEGNGLLTTGNTYKARFTYSPGSTDSVKLETFDVDGKTLLDTLVLQETLPSGAYRVGLSGDQDGSFGAPMAKAYFINLSITPGLYVPVQNWKFDSGGDLTLPTGGAILDTDGNVLLDARPVVPVNINLDGGGASTVYEATSLLFADGGFASTRRSVTDPLFDAGANGAGRVYGATDNLINGGGA